MTINLLRSDCWIDPCFDRMITGTQGIGLSVLRAEESRTSALEKLSQTDIYHVSASRDEVPAEWHVTSGLIEHCPRLKVVSSSGAGYDTVDVDACTKHNILVVNQAGGNADSVAEHTFGLILAVSRRIVESNNALRDGTGSSREDLMGREITHKTLGLIGLGHIGTRVAEIARMFKMEVLAFDPYLNSDTIRSRGGISTDFRDLLQRSDIVSLHCPRNRETENLFSDEQFRNMKKCALFISTARGGIHDESALYNALASGHLGGAGLDVWSIEPPSKSNPLLALSNVVSTYHTAGVTHEGRRNMAAIAAQQIIDICAGQKPSRMINPDVYPEVLKRLNKE